MKKALRLQPTSELYREWATGTPAALRVVSCVPESQTPDSESQRECAEACPTQ